MAFETLLLLCGLVFLVATFYASVGHGGASGYLAVLSFYALSPEVIATTALLLNVMVAGLACYQYTRAGYFNWSRTWPFLVASVPAAFMGGYALKLNPGWYGMILAMVLVWAAIRLLFSMREIETPDPLKPFHPWRVGVPLAGGIGLLSGAIGVGGGIFLSPILLAARWTTVKQTAATAACFIVVNSLAGLLGRYVSHTLVMDNLWPLFVAAFAGSVIGASLGAYYFNNKILRGLLGVVLLLAACHAVFKAVQY
jgi:uncharacterized membrane protein YfcA